MIDLDWRREGYVLSLRPDLVIIHRSAFFHALNADLGLVNAQLAQPVTASNYLKDINFSGTLTVADKGLANAHLTEALPAP